jgi:hypothetical protein
MRVPELIVAGVFAALGIRSFVYWIRHPLDGRGAGEHALFALHVTARVGMWLGLAALFVLYAVVGTTDPETGRREVTVGRAFVDAARRFSWMYPLLVGIAAVQFVTGWFLGRRTTDRSTR